MPEIHCTYAVTLRRLDPVNAIDAIRRCEQCTDEGVRDMANRVHCPLGDTVESILRGEEVTLDGAGPPEPRTPAYGPLGQAALPRGANPAGESAQSGEQAEQERHGAVLNYLREHARRSGSNLSPGRTAPDLGTHAGRLTSEIISTGMMDVENLSAKEIRDSAYLILSEIRRRPELTEGRRLSDYDGVVRMFLSDIAALERAGLRGRGREPTRRAVALRHSPEYIADFINQVGRTAAARACARNPRDPVGEHSRFIEWKERSLRQCSDQVGGHTLDRFYWHSESGQHEVLLQRYLDRMDTAVDRVTPQLSDYRRSVVMGAIRKLCETTARQGEDEFLSALGELEQRIRRSGR